MDALAPIRAVTQAALETASVLSLVRHPTPPPGLFSAFFSPVEIPGCTREEQRGSWDYLSLNIFALGGSAKLKGQYSERRRDLLRFKAPPKPSLVCLLTNSSTLVSMNLVCNSALVRSSVGRGISRSENSTLRWSDEASNLSLLTGGSHINSWDPAWMAEMVQSHDPTEGPWK